MAHARHAQEDERSETSGRVEYVRLYVRRVERSL